MILHALIGLDMTKLGDVEEVRNKLEKVRARVALEEAAGLDRKLALTIIDALRFGTAPIRGTKLLAVGREELINKIFDKLERVSRGNSALMVINGDYGVGKTLTLRVLQEYSFERNFATCFVTLTPRECPLYDLRTIYGHIVKSIRVNEYRDGPALEWILNNWADKVKRDMSTVGKVPWSFWKLNWAFKEALSIYFDSILRNNYVSAERALSWIHADIRTLREAKQIGLSVIITSENALEMLGNLTIMIRELGFQGLVILLDEAETVPSVCSLTKRIEAYHNLKQLSTSTSRTPYSFFIYATTPLFFSYLTDCGVGNVSAIRRETSDLESLSPSNYMNLALIIRDVYLTAYDWESDSRLTDNEIMKFLSQIVKIIGGNLTPRLIVRTLIKALDLCYEHTDITLQDVIEKFELNNE